MKHVQLNSWGGVLGNDRLTQSGCQNRWQFCSMARLPAGCASILLALFVIGTRTSIGTNGQVVARRVLAIYLSQAYCEKRSNHDTLPWHPQPGGYVPTERLLDLGPVLPRWLCYTVDGRNPPPPKKSWNDDSPVSTNQQWFRFVSNAIWVSSIHSSWERTAFWWHDTLQV